MKVTTKPQRQLNYVPAARWETRKDPVTGQERTSVVASGGAPVHRSQAKRRLLNRRKGSHRSGLPWRSR